MMKCVVLGDSISEGIGSKKLNYVTELSVKLGNKYTFVNLGKTGSTIRYPISVLDAILEECADVVIIMYGSVDAQIRPNLDRNRFGLSKLVPARYKIGGMLSPRAFYSEKWYRFLPDKLDNLFRYILKEFVLLTQGSVQWVHLDEFKEKYEELVKTFIRTGVKKIVIVSTAYLDDKYFLNSTKEYIQYNAVLRDIANKYNAAYIDLFNLQKNVVEASGWNTIYSKDHFHPNFEGYKKISEIIIPYLTNI